MKDYSIPFSYIVILITPLIMLISIFSKVSVTFKKNQCNDTKIFCSIDENVHYLKAVAENINSSSNVKNSHIWIPFFFTQTDVARFYINHTCYTRLHRHLLLHRLAPK